MITNELRGITMMKSEKIKRRKTLCLGALSLVLFIMPFVVEKLTMRGGPGRVFYEYLDDHAVLFWFASISIGVLAMITEWSREFKIGPFLGGLGAAFSTFCFFGMLLLALSTLPERDSCLRKIQTLEASE
jgi:hypothetical protein